MFLVNPDCVYVDLERLITWLLHACQGQGNKNFSIGILDDASSYGTFHGKDKVRRVHYSGETNSKAM